MWLGICYDYKETIVVAAILCGAGGRLIVDEGDLLLTVKKLTVENCSTA
jgi:hypothetical protein